MTHGGMYLEDLEVGMVTELPPITFTQKMRDRHVKLYGEDWPKSRLDEILKEGVIPSTLVISIVGGQMGEKDWLKIKFLRGYELKCHKAIYVGDTITTKCEITDVYPHRDSTKDYGFVKGQQDLFNQEGTLTYQRFMNWAVQRKNPE